MSASIQVAALRDMGCVRTNNEDNFAYNPALDLYVVCDGMGGMAAGEIASFLACNVALETFAAHPAQSPVVDRLSAAIRAANSAVRESAAQNSAYRGMGTTLVAAVVDGSKVYIGNVGDSRAYLLHGSQCVQLTVDHSYINELVRSGTVKVEDIDSVDLNGQKSVITRAIGVAPEVDPDFFAVHLDSNDLVLLASDGLTRYVESGAIREMVDVSDLNHSCRRLIDAARAAGGADNITCLLLRYTTPEAGQLPGSEPGEIVHAFLS